jgi:hypothetical protein
MLTCESRPTAVAIRVISRAPPPSNPARNTNGPRNGRVIGKGRWYYTSRPKDRLFSRPPPGWYLIDFARSRHTYPARTPVVVTAGWYYIF